MSEERAYQLTADSGRIGDSVGAVAFDGAPFQRPWLGKQAVLCGRSFAAQLRILGRFSLSSAEGLDATPGNTKARALLAVLALSPGGGCDRGRLAGLLWSESADAKTSLRQCVKDLRDALACAGVALLGADTRGLTLDLKHLWVDALELQRLARLGAEADPELLAGLHG